MSSAPEKAVLTVGFPYRLDRHVGRLVFIEFLLEGKTTAVYVGRRAA